MLKSDNYEYLLDTRLKKVYEKTWKEIPSRLSLLFNTRTSDKAIEYDYEMGDIGLPTTFDGQIDYQELYGQYRTTYEHEEIVTGIRIQRKLVDDDQYDVIDKSPQLLSRSMKLKRETDGSSIFSNAFSASYTGGDGKELCNSVHPNKTGSTQQRNTQTYELTLAYLKTVRLAMQKFTTDKGNKVGIIADTLLIPVDLSDQAMEITKSDLVPYEISNTVNVNRGRYKIIDWIQLSDANNWFMIDSSQMKMYLIWYNRIRTEFNRDEDSDTYVRKFSTYMRYSNGFSNWNWCYGLNVA